MDERSDELLPSELALLELYRDAGGPSPEVEDRLLARIQAQADIEADLADDDRAVLGAASRESAAAAPSVRLLTAALIAIVAFAAGVALTWGLRGDLVSVDDHRDTPSVSPMTADGARVHEVSPPTPSASCGPTVVEKRVEVPVPVRIHDGDDEAFDDDRDPTGTLPMPPSSGWDAHDDEPARDDGEPILRQRTIALAPWSPRRGRSRGSGAEPPRDAKRRGSRGTGSVGPTRGWPTRPSKPSTGAQGSNGPTPGNAGGRGPSNDGNDGGRGRPGGNDGSRGDDGNGPRPPTQPDPNDPNDAPPPSSTGDEPPPPEEPPDGEPGSDDDAMPDWQECENKYMACYDGLLPWCEQEPDACAQAAYACDLDYQYCIDPWADAWQECDQAVIDCYMDADAICVQAGEMVQPDQCMALYEQCELEYVDCLGAFGESENEPPAGHIYD